VREPSELRWQLLRRSSAELLIECEEDPILRAVLVWMLVEAMALPLDD
jgi:hypothetical protein